MSNDTLKIQKNKLESELEQKDEEINNHLDRIEHLENNVMQLETLIQEAEAEGKIDSEKYQNTRIKIELDEKEKEVRVLKNNLGFLRKENMNLKKELDDKNRDESHTYSVMQKDTDNEPLHALIKELQSKINKQQTEISTLRSSTSNSKIQTFDFEKELKEKDKRIEKLKVEINDLKEKDKTIEKLKLEIIDLKANSKLFEKSEGSRKTKSIATNLTGDLQEKLNKTRRQVVILEKKIAQYDTKDNHISSTISDKENLITDLKTKLTNLQNQIKQKEDNIRVYKKTISDLEAAQSKITRDLGSGNMSSLTDELQRRLNKAKYQIRTLDAKLEKYENSSKLETELENLKIKAKTQEEFLNEKTETIEMIKKEATKSHEEVQKLKKYIESIRPTKKVEEFIKISPNMDLRIKELKTMVKELEKQNSEQRLEITQLRKS